MRLHPAPGRELKPPNSDRSPILLIPSKCDASLLQRDIHPTEELLWRPHPVCAERRDQIGLVEEIFSDHKRRDILIDGIRRVEIQQELIAQPGRVGGIGKDPLIGSQTEREIEPIRIAVPQCRSFKMAWNKGIVFSLKSWIDGIG